MTDRELLEQALKALKANSLLVNGDDKLGGLVWCMDGYYAGCFDIEAVNKQTDESITALRERLAKREPINQCGEVCERAKLCAVCLAEMTKQPEQKCEPLADEEMRKIAAAIAKARGEK